MKKRNHGKAKATHSLSTSRERKPRNFSFYKLMLQAPIQSKKLRIPEKFARTYGDELSTAAILTVPTHESWEVALVREDNKLWFHDGWKEFVEYFSIGFAYFLQFIYEGNSKFEVHIFDTTACEISNPCNTRISDQKEPYNNYHNPNRFPSKKRSMNNKNSVQVLDVINLETDDDDDEKMHDDDDSGGDGDGDGDDDSSGGFSSSQLPCDGEELDQHEENKHSTEANVVEQGDQSEDLWLQHEKALTLAGFSKPGNPFFVTVIKERHLKRSPFAYVPAHFARVHLRCQAVKLEASDGRQWPVRCTRVGRCCLGGGWIFFARDNSLKRGDICVFELIDAKNCVLKVHVAKKSCIRSMLLD